MQFCAKLQWLTNLPVRRTEAEGADSSDLESLKMCREDPWITANPLLHRVSSNFRHVTYPCRCSNSVTFATSAASLRQWRSLSVSTQTLGGGAAGSGLVERAARRSAMCPSNF
eukprot:758644-Hanusia_phi.AAC.2